MIRMHTVYFCDQCGCIINDCEEGCMIYFLDLPNERFIFCCEDCRKEYLKEECFSEGWVYENGKIEKED